MRTTTLNFEARTLRHRKVTHCAVATLALCLLTLSLACANRRTSSEMFQLTPESPAHKAMQTRRFETPDSSELLSASAAVLQDLGFQIAESSADLGFLRGVKERSAREYGQEIARVIIALFSSLGIAAGSNTLVLIPVDLHQQINASLVAAPIRKNESQQEVRIVFYRLVWKSAGSSAGALVPPGQMKMEIVRDPLIYQTFFSRLSKSVFLEAHNI